MMKDERLLTVVGIDCGLAIFEPIKLYLYFKAIRLTLARISRFR
jgi:hypothetical protein